MKWKEKADQAPETEKSNVIEAGSRRHSAPEADEQKGSAAAAIYADSVSELNFAALQQNLNHCLTIIDNEVMKDYVPSLCRCPVIPLEEASLEELQQIQFFRISKLVYQEDEFSVHKLATIFNALSNKPCTLVLMIQSDGQNNDFYLGVRSRDVRHSTGTMKQLLEQSLLGLFPGSDTEGYYSEALQTDMERLCTGCVSSVTCIADYKQDKDSVGNKDFIQGLEKFVNSMQGKAFTAICIANNLEHQDLTETRKEYERIYSMMSPFANMQYNYALNQSKGTSDSDTRGNVRSVNVNRTAGVNTTINNAIAQTQGSSVSRTNTLTSGSNLSVGSGQNHTISASDGVSDSESTTKTVGVHAGVGTGLKIGKKQCGININAGMSGSVSRGRTHGTSHTDSVSDSISRNLTYGINASQAVGETIGENKSLTRTQSYGSGTQYSESEGSSFSVNTAHTKALSNTFGSSQAVTLNVQNKALTDTLDRLEKQLKRLDECESIGMWDFAAYFLGESAAEAETAASMYRSLVSGSQSGLEIAAVNTWTDEEEVKEISRYVTNFLHPAFLYQFEENPIGRQTIVDATALASTNELAIQLGLPRKSVKGLPVTEHAVFAQEVLRHYGKEDEKKTIALGVVHHLGRETETAVDLDLESLSMHTFITGSTGVGKSNTVYQILSQLLKNHVRFLVIEPAKGEYKNLFGDREDVSVYGTNPLLTELLRMNPFSFPKEIHIYEHLDRLVEIFNVCWPMYAAMPAVLKDAMERAYIKAGWDLKKSRNKYSDQLFPNFIDVLEQVDEVMEQSQYSNDNKGDYKGALCTRLRSLTNGINGLVFTSEELPPQDLFDKNVIVDLSRVGSSETKSLIMGLLVMKLQEYRIASCTGMNVPLNHVTVLEEAHNLLKRTSTEQTAEGANLQGKSVEMLTGAIAEMRTYGEGFMIADQSPGLLDISVIRNTNTKIIMRLPEYSDRELAGRAAGLKEEQIAELSKLNKGVAAVYQNDWLEAVLCKVEEYRGEAKTLALPQKAEIDKRDVKGEIISRMIAKDIYRLIDRIDDAVVYTNMPVAAKCLLFEYVKIPVPQRFDAAAAVAYELFSAESVFSAPEMRSLDYERQKRFLIEHLTPSIAPLPEDCSRIILYLVAYQNAQKTGNPSVRVFLHELMEAEG